MFIFLIFRKDSRLKKPLIINIEENNKRVFKANKLIFPLLIIKININTI